MIGMTTRRAVDFGNYTSVPTPDQVRCLLNAGYTKAIIGTSFGSVWREQLAVCSAGGMDVAEYVFPNMLPKQCDEWWIDCETPEATKGAIRWGCLNARREPKGIYTRRSWWVSETGDWQILREFPYLKLWDASYGDPPPAFIPYGGWQSREMHQWHDSTTLCGLNVDLNIIEAVAVAEEDELPKLVFNTDTKSVYLVGFKAPILIGAQAEVDQLTKAYGPQVAVSDATMKQMVGGG